MGAEKKSQAAEIPSGKEGVRYVEKFAKPLSFEGKPEEAPGIGEYAEESLITEYLMLPRTEVEWGMYEQFFAFLHGTEYRMQIARQLTRMKADPILFDHMGWDFYRRYVQGEKKARIVVNAVDADEWKNKFEVYKKTSKNEEEAKKQLIDEYEATVTQWDAEKKRVMLNISEGELALPPSVTLRHEMEHATQDNGRIHIQPTRSTPPKEIISLFDGAQLVLIDRALRRNGNLPVDTVSKKDDTPLYSRAIHFPSGKSCTPLQLAKLAEGYFHMSFPDAKGNFDRSAVQLLSSGEATRFIDELIYGDPQRSAAIRVQAQELARSRKLTLSAAIRQIITANPKTKTLWKNYERPLGKSA